MRIEYERREVIRYEEEMIKVLCGEPHLNIYREYVPCNCYTNVRIKITSHEWVPIYIKEPGDDAPLEITPLDDFDF